VFIALCAIGLSRSRLVTAFLLGKDKHDVYALPKPEQVVVMSLGYRSALADLLFAHVLVSSGIHLSEKRRFETAASYLRTINELDPRFATPYRFADTLLTAQAVKATLDDYISARQILERGMHELKYDLTLWLSGGQFMAYVAPPRIEVLAGAEVAKEWRMEGARRMARSCELVGKDESAPLHCVTAARLLSQAGELAALRQFVERVVSVNDDPEVQAQALASLSRALGEEEKRKLVLRRERYDRLRNRGLAFLGKDRFLLVGPHYDAFSCLEGSRRLTVDCATALVDYHQRLDVEEGR
jgi:tetratricopeptide (TPR) repeat protein